MNLPSPTKQMPTWIAPLLPIRPALRGRAVHSVQVERAVRAIPLLACRSLGLAVQPEAQEESGDVAAPADGAARVDAAGQEAGSHAEVPVESGVKGDPIDSPAD